MFLFWQLREFTFPDVSSTGRLFSFAYLSICTWIGQRITAFLSNRWTRMYVRETHGSRWLFVWRRLQNRESKTKENKETSHFAAQARSLHFTTTLMSNRCWKRWKHFLNAKAGNCLEMVKDKTISIRIDKAFCPFMKKFAFHSHTKIRVLSEKNIHEK